MYRLLATLFILFGTPLSAYAFLGMNAGATLQGALPAWTRQLGAQSVKVSTTSQSVTTDTSGNIFVAGTTAGGLDGSTLAGTSDFFVTKYNSTGTKQWTRQLGVASKDTSGNGVAVDSSGNVFVVGITLGGLDGNALTGWQDFYVTKYDSTGAKLWTRQLGVASSLTYGQAVATDSSGNIFVAGDTTGGLDGNSRTGSGDFFVTKYNSAGTKQWTRQLGVATTYTYGNGVATDSAGNIFVAGYTYGGLDGNSLTGTSDFFVTKYDPTGTKQWTRQLGVATNTTIGNAVATDSSGSIFVAGGTSGGLDGNTVIGTQDFFVTKYDSTGAKLWTRQLGIASKNTLGRGVATDSSGNILVAGLTGGGLDGNTLTGSQDFFVTQYNSTGTKQWTKQLGSLGPTTVSGWASATDTSGNLIVVGDTNGGLDGNSQTGLRDFFVTKYNSAGSKQWTRQLGVASSYTSAFAVATDSAGNIFVAGYTWDGLDGNTLTGYEDFFVTKYDSTGAKQWTRQMGVASADTRAYGVATDSSGNVLVTGYTSGGLDGNTLTGYEDFFVTKYNSTGAKQWTKQLGVASEYTEGYGVATDSSGNVLVTGYTSGGLDGNTLTGYEDFFVTKYDSTGAKLWTRQLGVASQNTSGNGVATDSAGNMFVAGYTSGGLDGNTLTGTSDFFVTKYDSAGVKQWTRQLGVASQNTSGNGVATDLAGNIFVAGYTRGGLDGNALTGTRDFFVTKFTASGLRQWTKQMGVPSKSVNAYSVSIDPAGHLYVSGTTPGGLDFNTLTGVSDFFACQYIGN